MPIRLPKPKFSDIFYTIICIFLIIYIVSARFNTGFKFFIVRSGSMKPVVNAGDVAVITLASADTEIHKGDVIAFKVLQVNEIIIHRVIALGSAGFVTKGDANEEMDSEPVDPDRVIGIYRFRIPLLGFFFEGIKKISQLVFREKRFIGWMLLAIIPLFFIITSKRKKIVSSELEENEDDSG